MIGKLRGVLDSYGEDFVVAKESDIMGVVKETASSKIA